jgi:hypothetical protein
MDFHQEFFAILVLENGLKKERGIVGALLVQGVLLINAWCHQVCGSQAQLVFGSLGLEKLPQSSVLEAESSPQRHSSTSLLKK